MPGLRCPSWGWSRRLGPVSGWEHLQSRVGEGHCPTGLPSEFWREHCTGRAKTRGWAGSSWLRGLQSCGGLSGGGASCARRLGPPHLRRCCGWMREAGQRGLLVVVAPVGTVTLWPQAQTDVAVRPVRTALKGELWSLTHTAVPPCRPPPFLPSLASFAAGPHAGLYALACVSETCCERGRTTTAGAGGRLGSGVKHFAPGPAKSA